MDEALIKFHNELPYDVSVFYTSDYCYKCLYQPLATVVNSQGNLSVVVNTPFTLTLRVATAGDANNTVCSLSKLFGEAGHYFFWIRELGSPKAVSCILSVDRSPNNAFM
ncbi:hypothetical protein DNTS_011000, partial [Danionella cerebrum]